MAELLHVRKRIVLDGCANIAQQPRTLGGKNLHEIAQQVNVSIQSVPQRRRIKAAAFQTFQFRIVIIHCKSTGLWPTPPSLRLLPSQAAPPASEKMEPLKRDAVKANFPHLILHLFGSMGRKISKIEVT